MDGHNISIITVMGMGVVLGRFPVGSPPGMPDSTGAGDGCSAVCFLYKDFKASFCFYYVDRVLSIADGYSCRVVSAIL